MEPLWTTRNSRWTTLRITAINQITTCIAVVFNVGEIAPHTLWGRFCDLRDLGGDSGFQGGGDVCRLKHTQMFNWFQKINICYFGIKAFDARSTPWFETKVIKHISDWSRINQTTVTWFCETLHCTKYPRPMRLWLVGSQALRFSRRLSGNRSFDLKTWNFHLKIY